jgi:transglutaminase-like putative cysteine protease
MKPAVAAAEKSIESVRRNISQIDPSTAHAGSQKIPIVRVSGELPTPPVPRSLWRPERPSNTSVILYCTITVAVVVGCLSTLRLFVGAGFAALLIVSVLVSIWIPFLARMARIPWVIGLAASAGVQTWVLLRWAADNTQAILTPATPGAPAISPGSPGEAVQRVTVESLPRIITTVHRFGTIPSLNIFGDRVTLATAAKLVREALLQVNSIVAPAPMLVGFGLVVASVSWIVGTLTEVFLGSFRARFEALLPMSVAAIAAALLISHTTDAHRLRWIAAVGAACAVHVVTVAALERRHLGNWFPGSKPFALRTAIVALAILGVIGATSLGIVERINVDRRESAIDWRVSQTETPSGPTSISSPLASMQRQLLQQSNLEQFRVKALADGQPLASYWRQTSLSKFGAGEEWKGSGSYRRVKAADELAVGSEDDGIVLEQEVEIGALPNDQLPVAWEARSVKAMASIDSSLNNDPSPTNDSSTNDSSSNGRNETIPSTSLPPSSNAAIPPKPFLSFDDASLTLLSSKHPRPGQRYRVRSVVRRSVPDDVASAVSVADPADPELQLPALPERIKALGERITVSQTSTVGKAKALQDYLRENYTYSLEVPENTVASPLDDFLFESKTGYCVQFAGAFVVLARSLGIPSRLALGYTPGKLTEEGYFSVTGKNAHAWPEVRLSDNRWVAFEPTPGRGNPDSEAITGIDGINTSDSPEPTATTTTTTTIAKAVSVPTIPNTVAQSEPATNQAQDSSAGKRWFVLVLALAFLFAAVVWLFRRRQEATVIVTARTRRSLRDQDPAAQIDAIWERAERRLGRKLLPRASQETEVAFAARAALLVPEVPALALLAQRARYANAATMQQADSEDAIELAEAIDLALQDKPTNGTS